LPLGVCMQGIGLDIRGVLEQAIKDIDRLPHPTRDKMAEQGDLAICHVIIADPAIAAIADMVFGQEILFVDIPLHAIG
jgi:hypothetical protein